MSCLTLDPKGVRSNPATVCSCQATCNPAAMPGIVILNVPVNFTQHAETSGGLNGKSNGWKVIRREIIEDGEEEVSWTSHSRLLSWALIGRTGLLQQFPMAPCLQLRVASYKIYTALYQKTCNAQPPPLCSNIPLPMFSLSSRAVCSSAGAVQWDLVMRQSHNTQSLNCYIKEFELT